MMRRLLILLFVLCSAISGWTPVLAQVEAMPEKSHAQTSAATANATHRCEDEQAPGCCGKQIHPMLCAACFAVVPAATAAFQRLAPSLVIVSSRQQAMEDSAIEPVHPPPKA